MSNIKAPKVKIQEVISHIYAPGGRVDAGKWKGYEHTVDRENGQLYVVSEAHVSERRAARAYFKGLKKLLSEANKGSSGVFEDIAEGYLHRKPLTVQERFNAYWRGCDNDDVVDIGNGAPFHIVSYVDGTYAIEIVGEPK